MALVIEEAEEMDWGALNVLVKLFNVLSWPSFTVVCPLYASFWAMEGDSHLTNQKCLTFWVIFALCKVFEQALVVLPVWLPFWPYTKGVATVLLVIPYFGGASYVYKHLVRPYLFENSQIWNILMGLRKGCLFFGGQNNSVDEIYTTINEDGQEELEKSTISQVTLEREHTSPASPKKVQKEWSCALCLVSTASQKCLMKHLKGKKHKANDETQKTGVLETEVTHDSYLMSKRNNGMVLLGNMVNLEKWGGFLGPITRPIRLCKWKKPDFGWMKLNTDGSIDRENAGFGGLLRDFKGDAICAFVSKAPFGHDIFLIELWAIWRGLVLALGLGIKVVWVESDSMSVVKTINGLQPYSGKADHCLKHIWQLLKKFEKYQVSHSWRETNRAADYLSKMVLEGSDVVLWPVDFPCSLCNIIRDDARGRIYRRR